MVLHLTGASGAGVTTLGHALAARLGCSVLDTDSFYWRPTDPPFNEAVPMPARLERLERALDDATERGRRSAVLAGSLAGWGDPLVQHFRAVLFVSAPTEVRLARLRRREAERHGARIAPGGDMHAGHLAFLDWAAAYEPGPTSGRSRAVHEAWLSGLPCPVLRVDGCEATEAQVAHVCGWLARMDAPG